MLLLPICHVLTSDEPLPLHSLPPTYWVFPIFWQDQVWFHEVVCLAGFSGSSSLGTCLGDLLYHLDECISKPRGVDGYVLNTSPFPYCVLHPSVHRNRQVPHVCMPTLLNYRGNWENGDNLPFGGIQLLIDGFYAIAFSGSLSLLHAGRPGVLPSAIVSGGLEHQDPWHSIGGPRSISAYFSIPGRML